MYEKSLECFALGSKIDKDSVPSATSLPSSLSHSNSLDEVSLLDTYTSLTKGKERERDKERDREDDSSSSGGAFLAVKRNKHVDVCVSDSGVSRHVKRKEKERSKHV